MNRTCSVPECGKPARSGRADWCKMHYHRWYRHGRIDAVSAKSGITVSHGRRYATTSDPTHPLAGSNGKVYVHRKVLYDAIGPGPHPCNWCGTSVDWLPRGNADALQVDHLNSWGDDNRLENLAPSCASCNTARAAQARADALREAGWWSVNDTVASLRSPGAGRRPRVA